MQIIVVQANSEDKTIDFILKDNGTFRPAPLKKPRPMLREETTEPEKKDKSKEKAKKDKKKGAKWYETAPTGKNRADKKKHAHGKSKVKTKSKAKKK